MMFNFKRIYTIYNITPEIWCYTGEISYCLLALSTVQNYVSDLNEIRYADFSTPGNDIEQFLSRKIA